MRFLQRLVVRSLCLRGEFSWFLFLFLIRDSVGLIFLKASGTYITLISDDQNKNHTIFDSEFQST